MKAIILFLVSMVILSGCVIDFSEDEGCDPGETVLRTAMVMVKTESGDTCKSAAIEGDHDQQTFYADSTTGYVTIKYNVPSCTEERERIEVGTTIFFKVYKDYNDQTLWRMYGIIMGTGTYYPEYTITFYEFTDLLSCIACL